jgi:hypothetical protein
LLFLNYLITKGEFIMRFTTKPELEKVPAPAKAKPAAPKQAVAQPAKKAPAKKAAKKAEKKED